MGRHTARRYEVAPRATEWQGFFMRSVGLAQGATQSFGSVSAIQADVQAKATLIRMRGQGIVQFDPAGVADAVEFALGIIIVSTDAATAGAASCPSPVEDADSSWIWHQIVPLGPSLQAAQENTDLSATVRFDIDSKAMRKVGPNETILFMADLAAVTGTGSVDFNVAARLLFKLT